MGTSARRPAAAGKGGATAAVRATVNAESAAANSSAVW
jgi:hypothetical protein